MRDFTAGRRMMVLSKGFDKEQDVEERYQTWEA